MKPNPVPEGYHTVTPYLLFRNGDQAIEFYKKVFNAIETARMRGPNDKIMHAEIRVGDSVIMLADEACCERGQAGIESLGGSPISLMLYLPDVDEICAGAVAAGATQIRPVENQFYGDRTGTIRDPFGYTWTIATHVEDVTPEEMGRRFRAFLEKE